MSKRFLGTLGAAVFAVLLSLSASLASAQISPAVSIPATAAAVLQVA
jgi:hypothetical protein